MADLALYIVFTLLLYREFPFLLGMQNCLGTYAEEAIAKFACGCCVTFMIERIFSSPDNVKDLYL